MHSCTFGGNPVSSAAGVAVLDYIEKNDLVSRAGQMGSKLLRRLADTISDLPCVGQIRGRGLFIGVELVRDKETKEPFPQEWQVTDRVVRRALDSGLVILGGVAGLLDGEAGDHFEILPPYVVEEEHIDFIATTLSQCLNHVITELPA
jgi:4-aminobutyrate aminotransferase-like enzyme